MPVWGRELAEPLAPEAPGEAVARGRLGALVAYLRTLQRPERGAPEEAPSG